MKATSRVAAGLLILSVALFVVGCMGPLIKAADRGDVQKVRSLLDQGAEINAEYDTFDKDGYVVGGSALHWAARKGHAQVAELLLDRGADINLRDKNNGETPLHVACEEGQLKVVQLLLDRGAEINPKTEGGITPLHRAAWGGHLQVARLLLEKGALCCEQDKDGDTPAETAKAKGHAALAQLFGQTGTGGLVVEPAAPRPAASAARPTTIPSPAAPGSDVEAPSLQRPAKQNRYAVVVGIEQYRAKLPKADFAAQDARTMGAYLTKTMGFAEENVAILVNENATKTDLEKYLEHWLPNRVEKDSTVFIYYSGHGAPNAKTGDAYLVPYDGDPAFVDATGYPLKRLYDHLGKLPAKEVVVLLDSCFSGAGGRSVIAKGMRPMVLSVENPVLAGGKTVVLAASKGDQVSSTYDQKGHGLLTYFFLKGIRGEADVNRDGSVDLAEVYEFLKPQVERTARREYNNDQTPQLLGNVKGVRLVEPAR